MASAGPIFGATDAAITQVAHLLERASAMVSSARGWRQRGLAFLAGSLSTLAFAPYFVWPILFLTFPMLIWLVDGAQADARPMRAAALATWWFAFGYFFFGLMWIGEAFLVEAEIFAWLLPFAVTLLPAAMAIYWAIAAGLAQCVWPRADQRTWKETVARLLMFAITLSIAEWFRGHLFTGFPWNTPGLAPTGTLALMQSASVLGMYGLTLWTVFICALPAVVIANYRSIGLRRSLLVAAAFAGGPLLVAYGLGSWRLSTPPSAPLPGVKLRIIQPSIPQRDKWIASKQSAIFAEHLTLSLQDSNGTKDDLAGITHVIWPEASMPFGPLDHPEALAAIGEMLPPNVYLLAGALRQVTDDVTGVRQAFNSLLVLGQGGGLVSLYDKIHLVPFGEYLPFQATLEAIGLQSLTRQRGGFAKGQSPKPLLDVPGLPKIGPMICYEAIFPGEVVQTSDRPGLLLIVTNDGWFGNSTGPYQHFHQARVRAVEQGLMVVRAANNGISGVISSEGRILQLIPINVRGTLDSRVYIGRDVTVYSQWGDYIFVLNLLVFFAALRFFWPLGPSVK